MRRIATAALGAVLLSGVAATAASADASPAIAPYAQAAAKVGADGTLQLTKGFDSVTKPATGRYCLHVSDGTINLDQAIINATLTGDGAGAGIRVYPGPTKSCGNAARTIQVAILDTNKALFDQGFFVAVS